MQYLFAVSDDETLRIVRNSTAHQVVCDDLLCLDIFRDEWQSIGICVGCYLDILNLPTVAGRAVAGVSEGKRDVLPTVILQSYVTTRTEAWAGAAWA